MSKFSLIARLQHWMDSVPGQTFMNYAYSWGAAVVILGTLFKLTHIPGANLMLFIGMGTEVFVFFVSGFDRPFNSQNTELADEFIDLEDLEAMKEAAHTVAEAGAATVAGGGTVVIGGGAPAGGTVVIGGGQPVTNGATGAAIEGGATVIGGGVIGGGAGISEEAAANLAAAAQAAAGAAALGQDAQGLLTNAQAANAPEVEDAIEAYVDQLQQLTEVLGRVREQAGRMTQDSEEMVNQQVGTIDQINDQTRKMAKQIEELNAVYARMIEALTVNMPKGVAPQA